MSTPTSTKWEPLLDYPDSDGQPMAENTLQFRWIVTIQENLDGMYRDNPNVFVAGDLLWYPVEGHPEIRIAPDALVAFNRPKGYRGSYLQWREGGIAPHVAFEILSPGNRPDEMDRKFEFYDRYGVEEYYIYDPDNHVFWGWIRRDGRLRPLPQYDGWISPRLGIRFDMSAVELVIYRPDGQRFVTFVESIEEQQETQRSVELERRAREQAERRADQERLAREQAQLRADQERLAREEAQRRAEQLAAVLRSHGIDPGA